MPLPIGLRTLLPDAPGGGQFLRLPGEAVSYRGGPTAPGDVMTRSLHLFSPRGEHFLREKILAAQAGHDPATFGVTIRRSTD